MKKLEVSVRGVVSFLLFSLTFAFYTIPYKKWCNFDDDFLVLHVADSVKSIIKKDGLNSNYISSINYPLTPRCNSNHKKYRKNSSGNVVYPSSYKDDAEASFFGVMYRPISNLLYMIELCFVSPLQARIHFLISMFMYSINISVVFYIFSMFFPVSYAFPGALVFAFYPCMSWIGRVSVQPYFIVLFLLGISFILLKKSIDEKRNRLAVASALPFLLAIFTQEIVFFYPAWLALILPLYLGVVRKKTPFSSENLKGTLFFLISFVFVIFLYASARFFTCPVMEGSGWLLFEPGQVFSRLSVRAFDFLTLFVDSFGLSWIPAGNRIRKGVILLFVLLSLFWLFVHSKRKVAALLLASGFVFLSWLSFAMAHQLRYIYLGIPFIIAGVLTMIFYFEGLGKKYVERAAIIYALFMVVVGGKSNYNYLKEFESRFNSCDRAYRKFIREVDQKSTICFVGLPQEWFPVEGMTQAVWLHRNSSEFPVYYDWLMNVRCYKNNTISNISVLPRGDLLNVKISGRLLTIKSKDSEKLWLQYKTPFGRTMPCSMGKFTPLVVDGSKAVEATIEIDERWHSDDLQFVTWDFEKGEFKMLEQSK